MSKRIHNEQADCERLLVSGFENKYDPSYYEILLLAKHYRQSGLGKKLIKDKILQFCQDMALEFNVVYYIQDIKSATVSAMKNSTFVSFRDVYIYEDELDKIRQYENFKIQKILFSMLVYAKSFYNKKTFSLSSLSNILTSSGTRITKSNFNSYLHELHEYVDIKVGRNLRAYFYLLYSSDRDDLDFSIKITELSDLYRCGEIYLDFVGGKELFWCEDCGVESQRESNRQKKCPKCN